MYTNARAHTHSKHTDCLVAVPWPAQKACIMMYLNSAKFKCPSKSRSNSSIIACISSSGSVSPKFSAIDFKSSTLIFPFLSTSKRSNVFKISCSGFLFNVFRVAIARNVSKSTRPLPLLSYSRINDIISGFFKSKPKARIAILNSW